MVPPSVIPAMSPAAIPPWGQTADLAILADTGMLGDGLPERVVQRLTATQLNRFELEFDYLGTIASTRGQALTDSDEVFARDLLARLQAEHPDPCARFSALGAMQTSLA